MKWKIRYVKEIPKGYVGMNYYAAKELKIPYPNKPNLILVKKEPKSLRKTTIEHEKVEAQLMKSGKSYHEAHLISNNLEDRKL